MSTENFFRLILPCILVAVLVAARIAAFPQELERFKKYRKLYLAFILVVMVGGFAIAGIVILVANANKEKGNPYADVIFAHGHFDNHRANICCLGCDCDTVHQTRLNRKETETL